MNMRASVAHPSPLLKPRAIVAPRENLTLLPPPDRLDTCWMTEALSEILCAQTSSLLSSHLHQNINRSACFFLSYQIESRFFFFFNSQLLLLTNKLVEKAPNKQKRAFSHFHHPSLQFVHGRFLPASTHTFYTPGGGRGLVEKERVDQMKGNLLIQRRKLFGLSADACARDVHLSSLHRVS